MSYNIIYILQLIFVSAKRKMLKNKDFKEVPYDINIINNDTNCNGQGFMVVITKRNKKRLFIFKYPVYDHNTMLQLILKYKNKFNIVQYSLTDNKENNQCNRIFDFTIEENYNKNVNKAHKNAFLTANEPKNYPKSNLINYQMIINLISIVFIVALLFIIIFYCKRKASKKRKEIIEI